MQCFLYKEETGGMGKWTQVNGVCCAERGLGEGTESQMGRGGIFFTSYLNSNTEVFSLGSVGIPSMYIF